MSKSKKRHNKWLKRRDARSAKMEKIEHKTKHKFGRRKEMYTAGQNQHLQKEWKKPAVVEEEYWEIEIECVDACSKAPEEVIIWICPLAKVKIDALMEKFPNIEWFSYLLGKKPDEKDNRTIVEDIYIPKQTVTATSVDEIDAPDFNKLPVIGALHSHHGMGNGFSGTDHKYVNGNHNISLVISKDGVAGQVRWQTPCGALKIVDAKVKPLMEVDFDKDSFLKTETEKIGKKTYSYTPATHVGSGVDYGVGRVFPQLNDQEQDLINELDNMDADNDAAIDKSGNDAYNKSVNKPTSKEEWVNEDQSLTDALKEAFGE